MPQQFPELAPANDSCAMPKPSRPPRRLLGVAAGAAVLAILSTVAVVLDRSGHHGTAEPPTAAAADRPPAFGGNPSSMPASPGDTRASLERVADGLSNAPADLSAARFEYISIRSWDSFAGGSPGGSPPVRWLLLWTTGRGTSRAVVLDEAHGCRIVDDQTGHELGPFDGPLSSDPDAVRRQILHEPLPPDAVPDLFGQITGLYSQRYVPLTTRRGILRMLAREPGVTTQPQATDRAGRTGIAVTFTYRPPMPFTVDKTLLFDPRTGQLLASHSQAHPRPDTTTPADPNDRYEIYELIMASSYTPDTHMRSAGCPE